MTSKFEEIWDIEAGYCRLSIEVAPCDFGPEHEVRMTPKILILKYFNRDNDHNTIGSWGTLLTKKPETDWWSFAGLVAEPGSSGCVCGCKTSPAWGGIDRETLRGPRWIDGMFPRINNPKNMQHDSTAWNLSPVSRRWLRRSEWTWTPLANSLTQKMGLAVPDGSRWFQKLQGLSDGLTGPQTCWSQQFNIIQYYQNLSEQNL